MIGLPPALLFLLYRPSLFTRTKVGLASNFRVRIESRSRVKSHYYEFKKKLKRSKKQRELVIVYMHCAIATSKGGIINRNTHHFRFSTIQ